MKIGDGSGTRKRLSQKAHRTLVRARFELLQSVAPERRSRMQRAGREHGLVRILKTCARAMSCCHVFGEPKALLSSDPALANNLLPFCPIRSDYGDKLRGGTTAWVCA